VGVVLRTRLRGVVVVTLVTLAVLAAAAAASNTGLGRFLVSSHVETGFVVRGHPWIETSLHAFLTKIVKDSPKRLKIDSERLRAVGFVGGAAEVLSGGKGSEGVSFVIELGSAAAARRAAEDDLRTAIRVQGHAPIMRLEFPAVPGVKAFTVGAAEGPGAGNAYWVEGRCVLGVGVARNGTGSLSDPILQGASGVYISTGGRCP
jgi:hypothetical protein